MTRKLQLLLTTLLLTIVGVTGAWAQSTYSWSASNWENDNRGEVTEDNGTLKVIQVKNHLVGIKTTTSFKLPLRQTYLIVTGTGFDSATNDPNATIGGKKINAKVKENDHFVVDVTEGLKKLDVDFFGNVTVPQVSIIVMTDQGNDKNGNTDSVDDISSDNPTITDISFFQPDFIDLATNSNLTTSTNDAVTINIEDSGCKKTLSFTQSTSNGDMGIFIEADNLLTSSNMYFVVEANCNVAADGKLKLRKLKVGDTAYEHNSGDNALTNREVSTGHYVAIQNCFGGSAPDNASISFHQALWGYCQDNATMASKKVEFYIKNAQKQEVKIYRAGLYNLAEIIAMYPSLGTTWRFKSADKCRIEAGGSSDKIQIKDNSTKKTNLTAKHAMQMLRSLGNLPAGINQIQLRAFAPGEGYTTPLNVDVLSDFSNITSFFVDEPEVKWFPTMNPIVKVAGSYTYFQYKDGTAPADVTSTVDGSGTNKMYTYTRNFKEGYNSCVLPFDITISDLPSGLSVWAFESATSEGTVTFTPASGTLSAVTPCIIKAEEVGLYLIPAASTPNVISSPESYYATSASNDIDIKFVGSFVNKVPDGDYTSTANYGISTDGTKFLKMIADDTKTTYYRAFLADGRPSGARELMLSFEDETTGISETMSAKQVFGEGTYFDLSGRRVAQPTKGLYIVNGKKVVIK